MGHLKIVSTRGFTLVELLVAMALGVTLLFGVTQIFSSSRDSARLQNAMASVQDGGRVAVEVLSRDIRNADFSGCLRDRTTLTNGLQGAPSPSFYDYYSLDTVGGNTADATTKVGSKNVIPNTDTLQIVSAAPVCPGVFNLAASLTSLAGDITLNGSCPGGIDDGAVLLVSNCSQGEIFIKTGGANQTIERDNSTAFTDKNSNSISNSSDQFQALYGLDATVMKPVVFTYFVAQGQNQNNALFRRENDQSFELIANVEDFQVEFGIDNDDDLAVEQFVAPAAVADPQQIIAVRTTITVASEELVQGNQLNRTYTATTNIRNRTAPGG
ncbi:PilW family protein [Halioxenophilus aromaticivorans]|uniref:Prepilin-type N-terminal cleavage/methylation domain-containing protein n=1 Tax=Halioxenophilus aromaticivorans TaxID=1306992 RepID=A0AAV3TYG5_9ALTE